MKKIIIVSIFIVLLAGCTRAECEEIRGDQVFDCFIYPETLPVFTPTVEIFPTRIPSRVDVVKPTPTKIKLLDILPPTPDIFFSPLFAPTPTPIF